MLARALALRGLAHAASVCRPLPSPSRTAAAPPHRPAARRGPLFEFDERDEEIPTAGGDGSQQPTRATGGPHRQGAVGARGWTHATTRHASTDAGPHAAPTGAPEARSRAGGGSGAASEPQGWTHAAPGGASTAAGGVAGGGPGVPSRAAGGAAPEPQAQQALAFLSQWASPGAAGGVPGGEGEGRRRPSVSIILCVDPGDGPFQRTHVCRTVGELEELLPSLRRLLEEGASPHAPPSPPPPAPAAAPAEAWPQGQGPKVALNLLLQWAAAHPRPALEALARRPGRPGRTSAALRAMAADAVPQPLGAEGAAFSPPAYRLVSSEGPGHAAHFVVRVAVALPGGLAAAEAEGEGARVRDAEHDAAARVVREDARMASLAALRAGSL
jgi:hypothetical protein